MLGSAKVFFPEIFDALKKWPVWLRAGLFLLVVAIAFVFVNNSSATLVTLLNTPFTVTTLGIATVVVSLSSLVWLLSWVGTKSRRRRLVYQFCDAWLEYLPFMFLLVTKIQAHEMKKDGDVFKFLNENREAIRSFHEWRAKLRELLFKVGESELAVADNQHWEKLKKESKILQAQPYLTPFSFILDQTQPWLIAVIHQESAWAALHISDEFIERVAFRYPNVERLWKRRQRKFKKIAEERDEDA